jgi:hypothetical protein
LQVSSLVMNARPLPVAIISWLLIAAGIIGIAYHAPEFRGNPFSSDAVLGVSIRLLAIVCGVFMLRGYNWARWLAMAWITYHVVIGGFHSLPHLLIHALLFLVFAIFLFRPQVTAFFTANRPQAP